MRRIGIGVVGEANTFLSSLFSSVGGADRSLASCWNRLLKDYQAIFFPCLIYMYNTEWPILLDVKPPPTWAITPSGHPGSELRESIAWRIKEKGLYIAATWLP